MSSFAEELARKNVAAFNNAQYRYDHMEPPCDDPQAVEAFEQWCEDEGLDPEQEDSNQWLADQAEEAAISAAEDRLLYAESYEPQGWEP